MRTDIIIISLALISLVSVWVAFISLAINLAYPEDKFSAKTLIVSMIVGLLSVIGIIYLGTHEI